MATPKGQQFTVKENSPLLKYLFGLFPERSKTSVKALLTNGQICINGEVKTAFDQPLWEGDKLVILPKGVSITREIDEQAKDELRRKGVELLYEDDSILVVNKRSGLATIAPKPATSGPDTSVKGGKAKLNASKKEDTVYSLLTDYVKVTARAARQNLHVKQDGPARVWIVHRIDRGTSGILVFAKTESVKGILQNRWDKIITERRYVAILEGELVPAFGKIQSYLYESPKSFKVHSVDNDRDGKAQLAITHYKTDTWFPALRQGPVRKYSLVEFSLETGRKNQIRVHASDKGCPIAGDSKYGAESNPLKRLALHAKTLSFYHPVTGELMKFNTKLPDAFTAFISAATGK
ncbi:MAG: RluA family pseudouridine synthase [Bacteroidales bacterium]|nr:RluA family pseudouridine synthase [Bacteroidales bacterium]